MRTILGLIDFSDVTGAVLTVATDAARAFQAKLVLLHVATPEARGKRDPERQDVSREGVAVEMRRNHRGLHIMEIESRKLGVDATALLVRNSSASGNPIRKILSEIRRIKPDLVVAGSHGHTALYELVLGSVSTAVVRKSTCPVLIVPGRRGPKTERP